MNLNPLHTARRRAGLTAYELAKQAGTREPRIYAFERERYRPTFAEAERIADVLHIDEAELFPDGFQREG